MNWESINLRTGEVRLTIKTAGDVQETTGILASPLVDALKDLQGDQTLSGPVFKDTKKNASIITVRFFDIMGMNWYRLGINYIVCKTEGCVAL